MTRFAPRLLVLVLSLVPACELKTQLDPDADTDATTGADTMNDSATTDSVSSTSVSSTSASSTSMSSDDGTTDGPPLDGPFVDCADLPAGGDTVAPGPPGPFVYFPEQSCDPRTSGSANGYRCCSTDPATADGDLPAYQDKGIDGSPPLYADANNGAGRWGMCIRTTDVPTGSGLLSDTAENCPIPCNPTWADDDVERVCGSGRVCCQTTELGANDCVQEDGVWRPVTGADIGNPNVMPPTNWNNVAHDTHQDPNGLVCAAASGGANTPEFVECVQHLSVANQRGWCMALEFGSSCADAVPSYVDACEAMN